MGGEIEEFLTKINILIRNISEKLANLSTPVILGVLFLIVILSNFMLVRVGLFLHSSDQWIYPMAADECLRGHCGVFPFLQGYCGMVLSWFRVFWVLIYDFLFSQGGDLTSTHIKGHLIFSYVITQFILVTSSYFMLRAYSSKIASIIVSVIVAVGFQSLIDVRGMDIYVALPIIGAMFLIYRARLSNPFFELQGKWLFLAAIASGFSYYSFRLFAFYIVAFFVPWHLCVPELKRIIRPHDWIQKLLLVLVFFFIALFLYLEIFGLDIATIGDKTIRLHSGPNLKFAIMFFIFLEISIHKSEITVSHIKRLCLCGIGFLIGVAPEIYYWISVSKMPYPLPTNSFVDILKSLTFAPFSFKEIMLGWDNTQCPTPRFDNTWLRFAPLFLFYTGQLALFYVAFFRKNIKPLFAPVVTVIILNVIAFSIFGMSGLAQTRYLIASIPVIILSFAVFWDLLGALKSQNTRLLAQGLLLVAFLINCIYQLQHRINTVYDYENNHYVERTLAIADFFKSQNVKVVLTRDTSRGGDPFCNVHSYIMTSGGRVLYAKPERYWYPRNIPEMVYKSNRVGVLLSPGEHLLPGNIEEFQGKKFLASQIKEISGFKLYIATAIEAKKY